MNIENILSALIGGAMTSLPAKSESSHYKRLAEMKILTDEENLLLDMALNTILFVILQQKGFKQEDGKDPEKNKQMDETLREAHSKYSAGILTNYLANKLGSVENANKFIAEHSSGNQASRG